MHEHILQPKIVKGQQLIVACLPRTITTMSCLDEKESFAERMRVVADRLGIPPKGKNRQASLGKLFNVSQEAARKWLSGESIPEMARCIEIAKRAEVSIEWLLTGRGVEVYSNTPEAKVLLAMQHMDEATKYQLVKIGDSLAEPEGNGDHPPNYAPKKANQ